LLISYLGEKLIINSLTRDGTYNDLVYNKWKVVKTPKEEALEKANAKLKKAKKAKKKA
jgi:hypothetical protein